ncbi:MAG: M48 family metallopeptidase [Candidatus Micrarchaeia archaeon]
MQEKVIAKEREFFIEQQAVASKTASAIVKDNRIIIKIPFFVSHEEADRLYENLKKRILKKLENDPYAFTAQRPKFYDKQQLEIMGKHFIVEVSERPRKTSTARLAGEKIEVALAEGIPNEEEDKQISALCMRAISSAILPEIEERVAHINNEYIHAQVAKVTIKYMQTRWGSCNPRKHIINLNFILLLAPQQILDYVILHELAHMKEANHSAKFWSIVKEAMPSYAEARIWLKKNGSKLSIS